ncbi:MAG TPA: tetratricopeptide repeat protein [Opitutaceae bacterium]|nr:tetratricopeptide repeat protein [Opitutaceae bacterium]
MKQPPAISEPQLPVTPRWRIALAAALLAGALLAAYHDCFRGALVFDDEPAILQNPTIRSLWPPWRIFWPPPDETVTGRPLANLTLAVNHAISGTHVWSYHAFNLLVHLLAALTLFGLLRRTLRLPSLRARFGAPALPLALAIALWWGLHPLQVEAVTYVIQRVESLMALFFLLTFYCLVRAVDSPRPGRWQGAAIAACLLGAATKEVIAVAPVLLFFYDRTFLAGTFREAWRRRGRFYLGLAGATWLLLAGLVASAGWNRNGTSGFDVGISPAAYWLTQFEAVVRYLWLAVWPHPLIFEYGTFWEKSARAVVPEAVVVVGLAAATLWALARRPRLGFLGGWFYAILAPTSVIPGRIQMIVEHRMYLPLAAIVTLLVLGLHTLLRRAPLTLTLTLALALALGVLTARRNADYRTALALWEDTVAKRPDNARAFNCLGVVQANAGQYPAAVASYRTAVRLRPAYPEAHNNFGDTLNRAGQPAAGMRELQIALAMEPDYAIAHSNLGNSLLQLGRVQEAIDHYETALRLKPDFLEARYDLGNGFLQAGRMADAIRCYEEVLRQDPEFTDAQYNLGNALFNTGRADQAVAHYEAALRVKPDWVEARSNLGNALLQAGRTNEAIAQFQAALRLRPGYAEGHNNLGAAYYQAGRIADAIREFETALQLKPDYADARDNLERMRALPH